MDARTGKMTGDMELGRGNLGVGEREGGPQSSVGTNVNSANHKDRV